MNHIKRILLAGLVLAAPIPTARAQFNYVTNNGTITITGYTGTGGFVTIPSTINGLPVTSIGDDAFEYNGGITMLDSVTLPNSVTNIGNFAFSGDTTLSSVTLGSGVMRIGNSAFVGCHIFNISLPNSLVSLGDAAFSDVLLSSVTIPAGVTNISGNPFPLCTSLTSIGVATNNPAYTNVAGILFSKDLTVLVGYPVAKTNGSYAISNGVVAIDNNAFNDCTKLTNVSIPSGVVSIGTNAFANCSGLTNVMIPASVTNIGAGPFSPCGNLTAIQVDTNNPDYHDVAGVLFDANQSLVQYPGGYPTNFYTVPNGTTSIQPGAFQVCSSLTGIAIPSGVASIGDYAFFGCSSLTNVTIPDSVTNLGFATFATCSALTNVTLSSNLAVIGIDAFGPSGLVSVTIPLGVTDIGNGAFAVTHLGAVTIPASVTNIEQFAFEYISTLSNVVISAGVSNIGRDAFERCTNLSGAYFEGNAPAADATAFQFDPRMTVYYLPGTSGWGTNLGGAPTAIWQPAIQGSGIQGGQFGFNISWASNLTVTVQANNDLTTTNWTALQSCTLTNGTFYFSDAATGSGQKYYRLSWP